VRHIAYSKIVEAVKELCIKSAYELPADVLTALTAAAKKESNTMAAKILQQLVENARLASVERIPLCQDTGLAVIFIEQGGEVVIECPAGKTAVDAINAGVIQGYEKGFLRKSIVSEPMQHRKNTGNNCSAVIHWSIVPGDKFKITFMAKGGGCENKSAFRMFKPTAAAGEITDWVVEVVKSAGADACPPFVVGVGIGGNFEVSCLLSKKALVRSIDKSNADTFYAGLEKDLLARINQLGVGPQGLGGDTTALAVLIETAPCHIASLPVAVNIECHSHRHGEVVI
jgi:fumarate hydratase subunit alpha